MASAGGRYPGSRVLPPRLPEEAMLPSGFPTSVAGPGATDAPGHSGGTAPDSHRLPSTDRGRQSIRRREVAPCPTLRRCSRSPPSSSPARPRACWRRGGGPTQPLSPTACCGSASGRSSRSSPSSTSPASSRRPRSAPALRSRTWRWRPHGGHRMGARRAVRCASRDTRAARSCVRRFTPTPASSGLPFTAALLGRDALPEAITYDQLVSTPWLLVVAFSIGAVHRDEQHSGERALRVFLTAQPRAVRAGGRPARPGRSRARLGGGRSRTCSWSRWRRSGSSRSASMRPRVRTRFPPALTRPVAAAVIVKLTVPVAVVAACAALIHDVPDAFLVQAAMPTGSQQPAAGGCLQPRPGDHLGSDRVFDARVLAWGLRRRRRMRQ